MKPDGKGKNANVTPNYPVATSSWLRLPRLMKHFFKERNLLDHFGPPSWNEGILSYPYLRPGMQADFHWGETVFHGMWPMYLWTTCHTGILIASSSKEAGHDYHREDEIGIWTSGNMDTAIQYGRPTNMFGDGNYIRVVWVCVEDKQRRINKAERVKALGGSQQLYPSEALCLKRLLVLPCAHGYSYEEIMTYWELDIEPVPPGCDPAKQIINIDRNFVKDPNFPDRNPDRISRWAPAGFKRRDEQKTVVRLSRRAGDRPPTGKENLANGVVSWCPSPQRFCRRGPRPLPRSLLRR